MTTDFESAFYRIVADNFSPDDNLPGFSPDRTATPRDWMPEQVADDAPVTDRSRVRHVITDPAHLLTGPSVARLEEHAPSPAGEWVKRDLYAEATRNESPPAANEHTATYNHPGNPNPYRAYPQPPATQLDAFEAYNEAMQQLYEQQDRAADAYERLIQLSDSDDTEE